MAMQDLTPNVALASIVLLPLALRRAGQPIRSLFDAPRSATLRGIRVAAMGGLIICAAAWQIARPHLLGVPVHDWAVLVYLLYLWAKTAELVRDARTVPPASPLL